MNREQIVSDVVVDCVRDVVVPITGYTGVEYQELDLTNTADLTAWLTKYSGSYTRASTMWVADYEGVYKETAINTPAFYGARWTGTEWVNTDTDGSALTNTIGLAFWPSTTNVIGSSQYRDFTHADWTKTNGSISAGSVTLIDGTSVSDKNTFTASANNATCILAAYTSASGIHSGGVFIKRKTGTGTIEITIDNGTTWVDVTSQVDADSNWHLCQTYLTVANPQFGIRLGTSGDEVYLDWAQMDDGYKYVSVHPIKGGTSLAAQDLHFEDAKLLADSKGSIYAEVQMLPEDIFVAPIVFLVTNNNSGRQLYITGDDDLRSLAGSTEIVTPNIFNGYTKVAVIWGGVTFQNFGNGTASTAGVYGGSWDLGTTYVGVRNSSDAQMNGIISKIRFYPNALTEAEAITLTS